MAQDSPPVGVSPIKAHDSEPMRRELITLDTLPIVSLSISSLLLDKSPRHGGENDEHTRMLAESEDQLPPIVVHGPSKRVIDGMHRVRAAILRGKTTIEAREYPGTQDDAFALAVRLNIAHGLPLTRAERTTAAAQIIQSHPQWSDRMIAATVGLSPKTVAKARRRSTGENPQSTTRIGHDGRARPINPAAGRLRVAALLTDNPTAPIRTIAHQAGVSSSTVHQVRQRLRAGQHPTPDHHPAPSHQHQPSTTDTSPYPGTAHGRAPARAVDITAALAHLTQDPALQASDTTRSLLRCLDRHRIDIPAANKIIRMVPPPQASPVAQLAREYARAWTHIATQLNHTATQTARREHR